MKLPDYFEYSCRSRIITGYTALEDFSECLNLTGSTNAVIITDAGVVTAGLIHIVKKVLHRKVRISEIFKDVPPDSDISVVNEIAGIYNKKNCDLIIAVGGGSVIDTAKGVNMVVSTGVKDIGSLAGAHRINRRLKPLIVIPTTSGTGSECTLVAVIGDHEHHAKHPFLSAFLIPDISVIDPRMTATLPPIITAATGMDALSHAVEGYYCLAKNPMSDSFSFQAINMIFRNLVKVVQKPGDKDGRLALAIASTLAGMAFSNSMVGLAHNIGHAAGSVCGIPHGVCMAILLPYALEFNMHKSSGEIGELLYPMAGEKVYSATPRDQRAEKAVEYIRKMNDELHEVTKGAHARYFKELRNPDGSRMIEPAHFREILEQVFNDPTNLYNPEETDRDEYRMILECAYEGTPTDFKRIKK